MKTILLVMFIMLSMNATIYAQDATDLREFKKSVSEFIEYRNSRKVPTPLDASLKARIVTFLQMNRDASAKDFKLFRVIRPAIGIIKTEFSRIYNSPQSNDYEQKITNKEDRELFKITLELFKKSKIQERLSCKGDEVEYTKSVDRQKALWQQVGKNPRDSDDEIAVLEKIVNECSANDNALWPLLSTLRWKSGSDIGYLKKFNERMLKSIVEDQVLHDYSGSYSLTAEINSNFKQEFFYFLSGYNFVNAKPILSSDQVQLVAEAALTKFPEVFSVQGLTGEGEEATEVFSIVAPMTELAVWLDYYKLVDLRKRYIAAFFKNNLVKQTLKGSNFKGSKEILDYLQQNNL